MSVSSLFPAHFKSPEGSKRRFKELRHKFRNSDIAQPLIDYAAKNNVDLVEDSAALERNEYGGVYFHRERKVIYSRHKPAVIILHEFRHAVQFDRLSHCDPDLVRDRYGDDLKKAFLVVAFMEADACYHQDKATHEMAGNYQTMRDPRVYFNYFTSQQRRMGQWFKDTANKNLLSLPFYRASSVDSGLGDKVQFGFWERLRGKILYRRFLKEEMKRDEGGGVGPDAADIAYMNRLARGICLDSKGDNYLSSGLVPPVQDQLFSLLWSKIFTPEVRAEVRLFEHRRDSGFHKSIVFGRGLMGPFSRVRPSYNDFE